MEKEYLIHNIDYKDNPEDQHQTMNITISDLEVAGQDVTATVGIDTFVNGVPSRSNKYEDVSLTGAGGGGVAEVTFMAKVEGEIYDLTGADTHIVMDSATINPKDPISLSYDNTTTINYIPSPGYIVDINFTDENGGYIIWNGVEDAPEITGDATFTEGSGIIINGTCTITLNCYLD